MVAAILALVLKIVAEESPSKKRKMAKVALAEE